MNLQNDSNENKSPHQGKETQQFNKWIVPSVILLVIFILLVTKAFNVFLAMMSFGFLALIVYGIYTLVTLHNKNPKRKQRFAYIGSVFLIGMIGTFITEDPSIKIKEEYEKKLEASIKQTEDVTRKTCEAEFEDIKKENEKLTAESKKLSDKLAGNDKKYASFEDEKNKLEEKVKELEGKVAQLDKEKSELVAQNEKLKVKPVAVAPSNSGSKNTSSSGSSSSGGTTNKVAAAKPQTSNVYYKNCSEVRAAGKAPIYRGEPGYAKHLDRDGDGIGCE